MTLILACREHGTPENVACVPWCTYGRYPINPHERAVAFDLVQMGEMATDTFRDWSDETPWPSQDRALEQFVSKEPEPCWPIGKMAVEWKGLTAIGYRTRDQQLAFYSKLKLVPWAPWYKRVWWQAQRNMAGFLRLYRH